MSARKSKTQKSSKPKQSEAEVAQMARSTAGACLVFRVRALSRKLTALYEEVLRPLGLKPTQMTVMTILAMTRGEASFSTVAQMSRLEASSLSRIIETMRRQGWVEIVVDPEDERVRYPQLTDAGRALYAEAHPLWRKAQRDARKLLGEDGADALTDLANTTLFDNAP